MKIEIGDKVSIINDEGNRVFGFVKRFVGKYYQTIILESNKGKVIHTGLTITAVLCPIRKHVKPTSKVSI